MKRKITKILAALALLVFTMPSLVAWGQTVSENDVLWTEPFAGNPSSSTTFSETTSWDDYINPTTFVPSDANSLSYTSSNAMANSGTATNMTGAHVWLNKSVDSYIQISGIKLYNTTKVKISWAQATSGSSTTVYYQFDGTGDFTSLSTCSGPNANFESAELSVANHTTIALRFFHPSNNAKNTRIDNLTLKATEVSGGTPTCVAPTFSPVAGTYLEAQNVTISTTTDDATIYYTTDGTDPTTSSSTYSSAVSVSTTTTIKAMATKEGYNNSAVASATFTISSLEHDGTEEDPYTVADARTAIDANVGVTGVYATGIVSQIVTEYNSQYSNITFDLVDEEGSTVTLRAYRCGGDDAANVAVGDIAVVSGNLTLYNGVYEFTSGCQLVSLTHPVAAVETPTFNPEAGTYTGTQTVTISCATTGATIYYTIDGTTPTNQSTEYTGPITVAETTTINAIAYNGTDHSAVATAVYNIVVPLTTMDEIMAAATAANATPADVAITFNNWIVSGVGTNEKRAFVTDGTKGFIIYNNNGGLTFTRGDVLTGTKSCQVRLLNGAPCVTGLNATDFTITQTGAQPTVTTTTIAALEAVNTGAVVDLGQLTWDGSYFVDGSNNAIYYYNTIYGDDTFTANTKYTVKGVYVHYTSGSVSPKEIAPRDADDIQEVVEPSITVFPASVNLDAEFHEVCTLAISYANYGEQAPNLAVIECNAAGVAQDYDWLSASIDENTVQYGVLANEGAARTAYLKVYDTEIEGVEFIVSINQEAYVAPATGDKYVKVTSTSDLADGQYLIVYEDGALAFDGSLETLDASNNTITVTINDSEIAVTTTTTASEFTINTTDGTIQSASGYYIGQTSDANGMKASKTEAYTNTISIDEDGNAVVLASGGAYLRYNATSGQERFRYFKSATYTNQKAIQLYKKVETAPAGYPYSVNGYGSSDGGYVLMATPTAASVDPASVGMITDQLGANVTPETSTYDLYSYDQAQDKEWRNYRVAQNFELEPGKGYLYASKDGVTLTFTGDLNPAFDDVALPYTEGNAIKSLYLAGNSSTEAQTFYVYDYDNDLELQTVNFLTMNGTGDGFTTTVATSLTAQPMQGFFVQSAGSNWLLSTEDLSDGTNNNQGVSLLNINVMRDRGNVIDNAIVSFSEGSMMNKFYLKDNTTRVYIPQGNREMAVVNSAAEAEMPVSFKASENGTYTLAVEAENVEMNYLHLIDNLTGMDVDLLQTPSYTFEAKTNDYTSRFRLVFKASSTSSEADETFAYYNGSSWTVSNLGEATLQVVDVTGRTVSSETINGNATISLNQTPGVYMLRLVNGNSVKVQKVVVR